MLYSEKAALLIHGFSRVEDVFVFLEMFQEIFGKDFNLDHNFTSVVIENIVKNIKLAEKGLDYSQYKEEHGSMADYFYDYDSSNMFGIENLGVMMSYGVLNKEGKDFLSITVGKFSDVNTKYYQNINISKELNKKNNFEKVRKLMIDYYNFRMKHK